MVDVGGAGGTGRGDAIVDDARLDGGTEATRRLDLLEDVPGPLGELLSELLDVPRSAGWVDHPGEVRLHRQHRLRVAGQAAAELARHAGREGVEGQHRDGVGAGNAGREAGDRGAQHVHRRVVAGHHRRRGDGVQRRARGGRRNAGNLGHARPEPAGGAELGDRGELVDRGREAQLEGGERVVQGVEGAQSDSTAAATVMPSSWPSDAPRSW